VQSAGRKQHASAAAAGSKRATEKRATKAIKKGGQERKARSTARGSPAADPTPCCTPLACTDTSSPLARLSVPISRISSWAQACSTSRPRRALQEPAQMCVSVGVV
jgi:hypothetical protein